MIPGNARETAEFGQDGALHFFRQHEISELQRSFVVCAIFDDDGAGETAAKRQILQLYQTGFSRQHALLDRLQNLVGPDRDHGDDAL
ncbi:hypothetical protein D3C73_604500 [compost metagenome]